MSESASSLQEGLTACDDARGGRADLVGDAFAGRGIGAVAVVTVTVAQRASWRGLEATKEAYLRQVVKAVANWDEYGPQKPSEILVAAQRTTQPGRVLGSCALTRPA